MNDNLLDRVHAALEESHRLRQAREAIFEHMTDIAVHRSIVASEAGRRVREAEREAVRASETALRMARL